MVDQLKFSFGEEFDSVDDGQRENRKAVKEFRKHQIILENVLIESSGRVIIIFSVIKPDRLKIELKFTFTEDQNNKGQSKKNQPNREVEKIIIEAPKGLNVFHNEDTYNDAIYIIPAVYNKISEWASAIYRSRLKSNKKGESSQQGVLDFGE